MSLSAAVVVILLFSLSACGPEPADVPVIPETTAGGQSPEPETVQVAGAPAGGSGPVLADEGTLEQVPGRPREIWRHQSESPVAAGPAVASGRVAVGYADRAIRAFDSESGQVAWTLESPVSPVALASNGEAFVVSGPEGTFSVDARTGTRGWLNPAGAAPGSGVTVTSRAAYVGTSSGALAAIDVTSGDSLWSLPALSSPGVPLVGSVAALDGVLYAAFRDGSITAARASDGSRVWSSTADSRVVAGPTVRPDGLYLATTGGSIVRLGLDRGDVSEAASGLPAIATRVIDGGSRLVVFDSTSGMHAGVLPLSDVTSAAAREAGFPALDLAGQPALLDSVILVSDVSGLLRGIDPGTAREVWTFPLGFGVFGSLSYDGQQVYAVGRTGALLLDSGRTWPLPEQGRFRMKDRLVELVYVSQAGAVVQWTVTSSVPDDPVLFTISASDGSRVASNMGKVELERSARAAVVAGGRYVIRIERPYPDRTVTIFVESEVLE
jgi:outer membrane protein assembly factor BamB